MRFLINLIRILGPDAKTIEQKLSENKIFRKIVLQTKNKVEDMVQDLVDSQNSIKTSNEDSKNDFQPEKKIKYLPYDKNHIDK
jgi:hypothetical protein